MVITTMQTRIVKTIIYLFIYLFGFELQFDNIYSHHYNAN